MSKSKKSNSPKLEKKWYVLVEDYPTQRKNYKAGNKIQLTKEGYRYLKSKKIVE